MFEQFIGTKPVEERQRIDVGALEKYLGFGIREIEQFKGGQSNPTYRLGAADGRRFVLRRKPPGKLLPRRTRSIANTVSSRRSIPPAFPSHARTRSARTNRSSVPRSM